MYIVLPRLRLRISIAALPAAIIMLWCEGAVPFFILMVSALFHELGHLIALKMSGYTCRRIDILPMGALIVVPEGIPYEIEYKISIAGPLASLILSAIACVWFMLYRSTPPLFLMLVNLTLAVFNLLPVKKLDGGKALWCFLMSKQKNAERICSALSLVSKLFVLILLSVSIVSSQYNLGVVILAFVLISQLFSE